MYAFITRGGDLMVQINGVRIEVLQEYDTSQRGKPCCKKPISSLLYSTCLGKQRWKSFKRFLFLKLKPSKCCAAHRGAKEGRAMRSPTFSTPHEQSWDKRPRAQTGFCMCLSAPHLNRPQTFTKPHPS